MTLDKAYERETEMWNQIFKECTPVDFRKLDLQVEMMFDEALKLFAEKTTNVPEIFQFNICSIRLHIKYWELMPQKSVFNLQRKRQD